jgi:hypothetical protein
MDTGLGLRRIEDELGFAVLLRHGVVVVHGHRSIRIPVCCHSEVEDCEIEAIGQGRRPEKRKKCRDEYFPQQGSETRGWSRVHGARL